jgi:tetratricopeptide (TPR) repeat protein
MDGWMGGAWRLNWPSEELNGDVTDCVSRSRSGRPHSVFNAPSGPHEQRGLEVRVCVLALLVCAAAGCAGHQPPDTRSLFIKGSQESSAGGATFDAPKGAADSSGAGAQAQIKSDPSAASSDSGVSKAPAPKADDLPTLETTDANLGVTIAALKRRPTANGYVAVGNAYHRLGVFDQAQANFQHALDINSTLPAASEGLARVWRDWGLPQFGLPYAYRAVSAAPKSPSAENTLGTLLFALGDPEAARTRFEKAVALDPKAVYALNNLCYVAFMLGEGGPAVARCNEALALSPDVTITQNNLALVYAAEGHTDQAADEFARAGDASAANFNMGIVQMARHEYRAAADLFRAACRATPEVAGACAWAAQARRLAGATPPADIRK